jgi:hypothetical protein
MTAHVFNVEIAVLLGLKEAIIIQHFYYWITKNIANNKNEYEGTHWTYNSVGAFQELFPYLGKNQIASALKSLVDNGYLIEGNYNKSNYDRTKWYAFTDKTWELLKNGSSISENQKSIYRKPEIHLPKTRNPFTENQKPIPDNKPDNKPDNILMSSLNRHDVPENLRHYFDIAQGFYLMFVKNLKDRGVKSTQFEAGAKFKTWVDPIRLMVEKKEATLEDLRAIFTYLSEKNFWSDTINSTAAIRKHLTRLMKEIMKKPPQNLKSEQEKQEEQWFLNL